jgi:NhaP-type Na+/H+ or K+/H+ antiporter
MFLIYTILAFGPVGGPPFDKLPRDQQVCLIGGVLVGVIVFYLIRGRMFGKMTDQTRRNLMTVIILAAVTVGYEMCRFIYFTFVR